MTDYRPRAVIGATAFGTPPVSRYSKGKPFANEPVDSRHSPAQEEK